MDGYLARLCIICSAFGESETRPINLLIREFVLMSRDSYSYRSTGPVVPKASSNLTGRSTTPSGSTLSSNHYLDISRAGNNADFFSVLAYFSDYVSVLQDVTKNQIYKRKVWLLG